MRENISVSIPKQIKAQLNFLVADDGVSRSEIIRVALEEYFWRRELRELRARAVPLAQSQGVHTDEDVFAAVS